MTRRSKSLADSTPAVVKRLLADRKHDLVLAEKLRYSAHIRLACTHCKLERYEAAYQETLLALQDHQKTDTSLNLNKLLQEMCSEIGGTPKTQQRCNKLAVEIDGQATDIMTELV